MGRAPPALRRAPRGRKRLPGACNAVRAIAACVVGDDEPTTFDRRSRRRGVAPGRRPGTPLPAEVDGEPVSNDLLPRDRAEEVALFRPGIIGALARATARPRRVRRRDRALAEEYRPPGPPRAPSATVRDARALALRVQAGRARGARARRRAPTAGAAASSRPAPRAPARHPARVSRGVGAADPDARSSARRAARPRARCAPRRYGASIAGRSQAPRRAEGGRPAATTRLRWQARAPARSGTATSATARRSSSARRRTPVRVHALLDDASRATSSRSRAHSHRARGGHARPPPRARCAATASPTRSTSTTARRTAATCSGSRASGSASRCCTPARDAPARGKMERFWRTMPPGLPRPPRHDDLAARRAGAPARRSSTRTTTARRTAG